MPAGEAGSPGQVLVSRGRDAAPVWQTLDSNGGGGNTGDQDWLVAQNNPNGVPNPPIPNNIDHWIYTNGRVGIGTSAPGAELDVVGSIAANPPSGVQPVYWYRHSGTTRFSTFVEGDGSKWYLGRYDNTGNFLDRPITVLRSNGNVGIGTTAPAQKLHVAGNVQFTGALMPNGIPGERGQVLVSKGPGNAPQWQTLGPGGTVIVEDKDWLVAANNPTGSPGTVPNNIDQWIYTNGRVGIGTANPGNFSYSHNILLHVHGNSSTGLTQIATSSVFGSQVSALNFGVTSGGSALPEKHGGLSASNRPTGLISFHESEGSDRQIIFRVNGNNSMAILGEGLVQVGALPNALFPGFTERSRFGVVMDLHRANYCMSPNNRIVFEIGTSVFQGSTRSIISGADFISTIRSRFDSNSNITEYRFANYLSSARYDHSPRISMNAAFDSVIWCWAPQGVTPPPGYQKSVDMIRGMSQVALNTYSNVGGGGGVGYPAGVPPITPGSGITSSIVGLAMVFDQTQIFPHMDYLFINCHNFGERNGQTVAAGIFVVHGRGHMYLHSDDSGGAIAYKNGSLTWVAPSDARLKTNIRPITGALEKIGQLRGVSFDWINQDLHKGDPTSGFLAQEMEKVFPDCVNEVDSPAGDNADSKLTGGKIKTVGLTSGFFATMVEAIKEQQQIIEGLQKTVAQQQQLIDLQNQKIAQLEQKLEELANKRGS